MHICIYTHLRLLFFSFQVGQMNDIKSKTNENCCCHVILFISHVTCDDPRFQTGVMLVRPQRTHLMLLTVVPAI